VHFGYSDSISQPDILPAPTRQPGAPPAVPPGMFVLGHPDGPRDNDSFAVANQPVPLPTSLMRNGTFGASPAIPRELFNSFDYRPTEALPQAVVDGHGSICPAGSHIRRSNPRIYRAS